MEDSKRTRKVKSARGSEESKCGETERRKRGAKRAVKLEMDTKGRADGGTMEI